MTYFTVASVWGYLVLKDTNWLPWWMGGTQNTSDVAPNMWANAPFTPYPEPVFKYFLYTTGYHLGGLLKHLYENQDNNDFHEMMLHHVATIALMTGSFLTNFMGVGACIAWLHDIG